MDVNIETCAVNGTYLQVDQGQGDDLINTLAFIASTRSTRSSTEMLTIHQQPTTGTLQLPPELLHKVITWVLAQSVHSICVSSDEVGWELKLMETLCLVSSAFRDIALEVACKAFGIRREEDHPNYPRWACDYERCDG